MTKYSKIVVKNEKELLAAGHIKLAEDLAILLDANEFAIPSSDKWTYDIKELIKARERVFNKFCAVCIAANAGLPPVETEFFESRLHSEYNMELEEEIVLEQIRAKKFIRQQLSGKRSQKAILCRSLQRVMDLFPRPGYERFDEEKLFAMMNILLVNEGCKPLRPDYSKIRLNTQQTLAPEKEIKILIVDDCKDVALRTASALAGWPKLKIEFYFYCRKLQWKMLKDEAKEEALSATALDVLKRSTDVILMDQGLGDIQGSDLIAKIRDLSETPPLFVGNTAGSDSELLSAGALTNCDKGEQLWGIIDAIKMLS